MESQEPKPKKDIGLTTIELEIPETYIDDDNFFSKSISWKRRLKIVEKSFDYIHGYHRNSFISIYSFMD